MFHAFNTIINRVASEPGYVREVVDGLNNTYFIIIFNLTTTVKLPTIKRFDTKMEIHK